MISVICPFYNEELIIRNSVKEMLSNLESLNDSWELIVVNDGSTDKSLSVVEELAAKNSKLRVAGYPCNRGRGYALRTGAQLAKGDVIITTEIDCSWGSDIVSRLADAIKLRPDADMVIASCNLPGGGYVNVPQKRVRISKLGNILLRLLLSPRITMYTGMTRAYRKKKYLELPLDEVEKEHHLEVVRKAIAFGYTIYEIPATIEWRKTKESKPNCCQRKSSSKIGKLVRTHFLFGVSAAPFRYIFPFGGGIIFCGILFMFWAFLNFFTGNTSILLAILSTSLILFGFLVIAIGMLAYQGLEIQEDIWKLRSELIKQNMPCFESDTSCTNPGKIDH